MATASSVYVCNNRVKGESGASITAIHHGFATADSDGDGALDFLVNNLDSPAGLYRNTAEAPRVAGASAAPPEAARREIVCQPSPPLPILRHL